MEKALGHYQMDGRKREKPLFLHPSSSASHALLQTWTPSRLVAQTNPPELCWRDQPLTVSSSRVGREPANNLSSHDLIS